MTPSTPRRDTPYSNTERRKPHQPGKIEKIVTIAALSAVVLLLTVDVVRATPPDVPMVQVTFDVAPANDLLLPHTDDRWSADQSAEGTRPDAVH